MARQRDAKAFGDKRASAGGRRTGRSSSARPVTPAGGTQARGAKARGAQVIPDAVAKRMARRIAFATGIPSLLGMAVIVASYLLVSRGILSIAPVVTLLSSGGLFLLGVVGLSYGVISASWEEGPGSVLGLEQIPLNITRIRESVRAMRQGGGSAG
jgi:hypothetical protein